MNSCDLYCRDIVEENYITPGHTACAGCGERLALNYALKALGDRTVIVIPASCSAVVDGMFPSSSSKVTVVHNTFESTAAVATGVKRAFETQGKRDISVLAWAGDGGTYDIGLQALSGAAERNENIVFICYDNEAYMNTGMQRSSATPFKSITTTTPPGAAKGQQKKDIIGIMAAHNIPYAATASIAFPEDFIKKVNKAKTIHGFKFILIFSPCPTGWKYDPEFTVRIARLATETRIFPLYEIYDGIYYSVEKDLKHREIKDYFDLQGRFRDITRRDIESIKDNVEKFWKLLLQKEVLSYKDGFTG